MGRMCTSSGATHDSPAQQYVQQRQDEPVRPTLSIDEGHAWKDKKKRSAVLPGGEIWTSLDSRDHVSHIISFPDRHAAA